MSAIELNESVIPSQRSMTFNELSIRDESYYDQVLCERTETLSAHKGSAPLSLTGTARGRALTTTIMR